MNAAFLESDNTLWVDDLAARWTQSVLEVLKAAGIQGSSVAMELETWHTLKDVLQSALDQREGRRLPPLSLKEFLAQVLIRATLRVARKFEPGSDAFALKNRIRPWIQDPTPQASEHDDYLMTFRQAAAKSASRQSSRFGHLPRMAAVGS